MEYTTLREQAIPRRLPKPQRPEQQKTPTAQRPKPQRKCPSGFRWDSAKGKCVQTGVGPEYRP